MDRRARKKKCRLSTAALKIKLFTIFKMNVNDTNENYI